MFKYNSKSSDIVRGPSFPSPIILGGGERESPHENVLKIQAKLIKLAICPRQFNWRSFIIVLFIDYEQFQIIFKEADVDADAKAKVTGITFSSNKTAKYIIFISKKQ